MTTFLSIAFINSMTVIPLAIVALVIGRTFQRPALTHSVWVLVLLKLVTPPIFQLPVTIDLSTVPEVAYEARRDANATTTVSTSKASTIINPQDSHRLPDGPANHLASTSPIIEPSAETHTRQHHIASLALTVHYLMIRIAQRPGLLPTLAGIWLAGTVAWIALQGLRAYRFQRRVQWDAYPSAELQRQTQALGAKMGLKNVPEVLVLDAAVSPLLWGISSNTKLLFPKDLVERMDIDARATLLTHELAHFARRDHWVRVLELIATGLFWWHPIVWWARQQIEESEEECCDAWVVGEFPEAPRRYAEALLDTIDFLCEARQSLSPVSTGLGQSHFLRLRLTKIMRGTAPKSLCPNLRRATAFVSITLLMVQPFVLGSTRHADVSPSPTDSVAVSVAPIPPPAATPPKEATEWLTASATESPTPSQPSGLSNTSTFPKSSRMRAARGAKIWSTAASPDGRFIARATTARELILTDRTSNREFDMSSHQISAIAFTQDGESFVAAGTDGRLTLWDGANGELLRTIFAQSEGLRSVAVSPVDGSVAVGGRDGSVMLFDLTTGNSIVPMPSFPSSVNCVRFSPDGRQLAVAVGDWSTENHGEVSLLNTADGQIIAKLECPATPGAISFASNEELIVGLWNGHADLWNLNSVQVVGIAYADKSIVAAAAFSPDNPALREMTFEAVRPAATEKRSPFSVLQGLLRLP